MLRHDMKCVRGSKWCVNTGLSVTVNDTPAQLSTNSADAIHGSGEALAKALKLCAAVTRLH